MPSCPTTRGDRNSDYHSHSHLAPGHRSRSPPSLRISNQPSSTSATTPTSHTDTNAPSKKRPLPGRERFALIEDTHSSDDDSSPPPAVFPQTTKTKVSQHDSALSLDKSAPTTAPTTPSIMHNLTTTGAYIPPLALRVGYDKAYTSDLAMYSTPDIVAATIMHRLYSQWIMDPMGAVREHVKASERGDKDGQDTATVSVEPLDIGGQTQVFQFHEAKVRAGDRMVSGVGPSEVVAIRVAAAAALALW